jgi:hypothetical protein
MDSGFDAEMAGLAAALPGTSKSGRRAVRYVGVGPARAMPDATNANAPAVLHANCVAAQSEIDAAGHTMPAHSRYA